MPVMPWMARLGSVGQVQSVRHGVLVGLPFNRRHSDRCVGNLHIQGLDVCISAFVKTTHDSSLLAICSALGDSSPEIGHLDHGAMANARLLGGERQQVALKGLLHVAQLGGTVPAEGAHERVE